LPVLDPEVALDGWATALVLGALVALALNALARYRSFRTARETAKVDLWQNLVWLAYRDWQRRNPDAAPRDHHFAMFDLFPTYAPVLIRAKPETARSLLLLHGWWAQYDRSGMPKGWSLADDDRIELGDAARELDHAFRFGWNREVLDRLFFDFNFSVR
jgi:hypothetical protein